MGKVRGCGDDNRPCPWITSRPRVLGCIEEVKFSARCIVSIKACLILVYTKMNRNLMTLELTHHWTLRALYSFGYRSADSTGWRIDIFEEAS